jgi:hypothetical protein
MSVQLDGRLLKFTPRVITREIEFTDNKLIPVIRLKTDVVTGVGQPFGFRIPKVYDISSYTHLVFKCKLKYVSKFSDFNNWVINRFSNSGRLFGLNYSNNVFSAAIVNANGSDLTTYQLSQTFNLNELTELTFTYDKSTSVFEFYASKTKLMSQNVGNIAISTWTPSFGLSMTPSLCLGNGDVVDVSSISLKGDGQELL